MKVTDNIDIKITIATQQLTVKVAYAEQELAREVERHIDSIYRRWRPEFPHKSESELLAMLAYQYATFYFRLREQQKVSAQMLTDMEQGLGRFLEAAGAPPSTTPDGA